MQIKTHTVQATLRVPEILDKVANTKMFKSRNSFYVNAIWDYVYCLYQSSDVLEAPIQKECEVYLSQLREQLYSGFIAYMGTQSMYSNCYRNFNAAKNQFEFHSSDGYYYISGDIFDIYWSHFISSNDVLNEAYAVICAKLGKEIWFEYKEPAESMKYGLRINLI